MISPTRSILQRLENYPLARDVMEVAQNKNPRQRVRIGDEWSEQVYFPEDTDYENPSLIDSLGWVWLPPFNESLRT